ncbi:uncharacterized protein LOC126406530 isoform X2 [Epinephelus moara]|uniref:uncharacterized protein LOC126406530 isoform X2 n=1 Tax=Epinephelus moara TaxID=300413 RepID=UPI00214F5FEF|nr:uncharacterized protein LOC126406530 isoform X2 [Epinephelus moara]
MPGQGSTLRECVVCNAQLNVACKTCKICKAEQPRKLRLKNKIENFDKKQESWVNTHMKNRTASHICDEGYILLYEFNRFSVQNGHIQSEPSSTRVDPLAGPPMASPDPPVPVALDPPAVSVAPVTTPPLTTPPLTRPPLTRPPLTTPPLTTPTQACVGANTDQAVTDHATTDHATTDHDTSSPKWNLGSLSRTTCSVDRIPSTQNMEKERAKKYSLWSGNRANSAK